MLAWLDLSSTEFSLNIEKAFGYFLGSVKNGGRYGSTQATVLSLKALVKYTRIFGGIKGKGELVLYLGSRKI